ncbi:hypothetical protein Patl1_03622 [Pistacia atlantica]|uniref:Uncharacterized protein n=1 Tax=Pistacia atlantica TaxID=434234 RepID=A0ACC1C5F5_9ROSI|nr:hypothetical protein Patl1_03622 [Pistacia atlantica]
MAGTSNDRDVESDQQSFSKPTEVLPDVHNTGAKVERAGDAYRVYAGLVDRPSRGEIWALPGQGWSKTRKGFVCGLDQMDVYERLIQRSISVSNMNFSPLEWTSISWFIGLVLATPFVGLISTHLDHGQNQQLVAAAATAIGALFCLPVGFFRTVWIFPLYIAPIVAAYIIAAASHTRHFGLLVRGFTGPTLQPSQFPHRRGVSGWFSLYATAAGCLGSAIISAFGYHMIKSKEIVTSLWVVSIFSGLIWLIGLSHVISIRPGTTPSSLVPKTYFLTLFKLSSRHWKSDCVYFIFPSISLPLLQPLQQVIKANAVKMQVLGFLLALITSGVGYCFRNHNWENQHILLFAAIQSTSTGLLHAFGRVLLLDCSPGGKEGAFSIWLSWVKAIGTCAGFAVASAVPGDIHTCFKVTFCTAVIGNLVLIFGNISDFGGAKAAGLLREDSERGSPVSGLDTSIIIKEAVPDQVN